MSLNFDVVEEKLMNDDEEIILFYDMLDWDVDVLGDYSGRYVRKAYDVEYPIYYISKYVYASYLKKKAEDITQEDLDNIDVDKFYDFLCDYYIDEAMNYAADHNKYDDYDGGWDDRDDY